MNASVFTLKAASVRLSRLARLPAHVLVLAEPVGFVEGRVGKDVVGVEVEMKVVAEGGGALEAVVSFNVVEDEFHHGESVGVQKATVM